MVIICQYGGEFVTNSDGNLNYNNGEAHAIDISCDVSFDELKSEITSICNIDLNGMSLKYFLPNNRRTLITISSDKDLRRMVNFNANSGPTEVFIMNKVDIRAPRSTVADSGTSVIAAAEAAHGVRRKRLTAGGRSSRGKVAESANPIAANNVAIVNVNNGMSIKVDNRPVTVGVIMENIMEPRPSIAHHMDERTNGGILAEPNIFGSLPMLDTVRPINAKTLSDTIITGVGQEFDNVRDFRAQLCKYAIGKGFAYKFIKNETSRVTARCVEENCPWRIHASESSRKQKFVIKKMNYTHTCGGGNGRGGHSRASRPWLISIIKEKLHEAPQCKPKDIVREVYEDFGVTVTYSQVWRGREVAQKELYNTLTEVYRQLPWFRERILETNPRSVATLMPSHDSKLCRFFLSFYASLYGFEQGCRPLLFLGRVPLKANTDCKLLVAAGIDGDDAIFPVAFSVVEDETYSSWVWFLTELRFALSTSRIITFVSDRKKGLEQAVPQVFEDNYHSYCLHHLIEDFKEELKNGPWSQQVKDALVDDFIRAAQACTPEEFNGCLQNIRNASTDLADWVITTKPENWSDALFKGSRYDHFSSNILDSLNNWIPVKHESSIVQMLDSIRGKLMEVMHSRREASGTWASTLTPSMEQKLHTELAKTHRLDVLCSSDTIYEVRGDTIYVVNTGSCECTCRRWQISGLPCIHALAALNRVGRSFYDYCSKYFTTEMYHLAYSASIQPIPDVERIYLNNNGDYYPPSNRRPPGRPRRKRINPNKTTTVIRLCSRCKMAGHNKATCEALL